MYSGGLVDEDEAREFSNKAGFATEFQRLLFSRVVPNLSRIGLLQIKLGHYMISWAY